MGQADLLSSLWASTVHALILVLAATKQRQRYADKCLKGERLGPGQVGGVSVGPIEHVSRLGLPAKIILHELPQKSERNENRDKFS